MGAKKMSQGYRIICIIGYNTDYRKVKFLKSLLSYDTGILSVIEYNPYYSL